MTGAGEDAALATSDDELAAISTFEAVLNLCCTPPSRDAADSKPAANAPPKPRKNAEAEPGTDAAAPVQIAEQATETLPLRLEIPPPSKPETGFDHDKTERAGEHGPLTSPPTSPPASAAASLNVLAILPDAVRSAPQAAAAKPEPVPITPPEPPLVARSDAQDLSAPAMSNGDLAFAARLVPTERAPDLSEPVTAADADRAEPARLITTRIASQPLAGVPAPQIDPGKSQAPAPEPVPHSSVSEPAGPRQQAGRLAAPAAAASTAAAQSVAHVAKADAISIPVSGLAPGAGAIVSQNHPPSASRIEITSLSPAARMERVIEPLDAPLSSSRDFTVRIADATERGADVRFVDRGSEVHVSVRTSDAELAQTLRGGLSDLAGRLEHSGIRTEMWRPGADASSPQNNSHNPSPGSKGFGSGRNRPGSEQREDHPQDGSKPAWVEELETSLGRQASQ